MDPGAKGSRTGTCLGLFFFEKRCERPLPFFSFLIGLDPFFLGERGSRGGAPEGLQGSGPSSALGGTGRDAGARCALPVALGGCLALHLMHSGCLSHPGAPRKLSHSP